MSIPRRRSSSPGPPLITSTGTRSENEPATAFTMLWPPAPYVTQTTAPEELVEGTAVAHFVAVHGQDDVARLQARLLAGTSGQEAGDDDVLLHRVREDAEPGAAREANREAVREEAVRRVEVVLGRHDEREPADLVQVERDDAEDLPARVEQRAAAETWSHPR